MVDKAISASQCVKSFGSTSYATIAAGSASKAVTDPASGFKCGQVHNISGTRNAQIAYLSFDTSDIVSAPDSVELRLGVLSNTADPALDSQFFAGVVRVATYDWPTGTSAWRTTAQLAGFTVLGSETTVGFDFEDTMVISIPPSAIVLGGTTKLAIYLDVQATGTDTPLGTGGTETGFQVINFIGPDVAESPQAVLRLTDVLAPTVTSVTPSSGPTAGGTSVTIAGDNLTGATDVDFGATPAASFNVDSDEQITAVSPAHAAGTVQVVVTTPGGSSG